MKRAKKVISFLLAAGLAFGSVLPAVAFGKPAEAEEILREGYASTEDAYAIYPVPQSTVYSGGEFTLAKDVQVVSEEGIDTYTNSFLEEILADYGRTGKQGAVPGSGQKILLGIKGSGGAVDTWADEHLSLSRAALFDQTDSYLLSAQDGTVVILGRDTDAV